jgi:hypothetical protein
MQAMRIMTVLPVMRVAAFQEQPTASPGPRPARR